MKKENPKVNLDRIQGSTDSIRREGNHPTIIIRAALTRRGGERAITGPDGKSVGPGERLDDTLLRNLAQAHAWRRALEDGSRGSVHELAAAAKCDQRYVRKLLRVAYLAPDIVEGILDGLQPESLELKHLTDPKLPFDWPGQRSALRFNPRGTKTALRASSIKRTLLPKTSASKNGPRK